MTGDNNTPQPQWSPDTSPPTEPTPKRKTRAEAVSPEAASSTSATTASAKPTRQAARASVAAMPAPAPIPTALTQPGSPTSNQSSGSSQVASAPANQAPDFGNGNIFGEAFATLLNQVEIAKQHERELEERAAQEALARALADKVPTANSLAATASNQSPALQPAPAPQIEAASDTVAPTATGFAAQMQALKQAQTAQNGPSTAAPVPASLTIPPSTAQGAVQLQDSAPLQATAPLQSSTLLQGSVNQLAYVQPAASPNPLVSELQYAQASYPASQDTELRYIAEPVSAAGLNTSVGLNDVPPEVLAQAPAMPDHLTDQLAHPFSVPSSVQHLRPRFEATGPFLARFLPEVPSSHTGIQAGFCNLHDFLGFLHEQNWYGYLHAALGEQSAYVLVYEGRTVAAACLSSTGEQALGELLHLYEQGARLNAYPLESHLAHILSGVGSRAWKFNLTDDFTGLHAKPDEAAYYYQGRVVATMPTGLPYEGAFPAPLRPQTLVLPRSLAGWAHHSYSATLRGRDALNAITPAHQAFKAKFGTVGLSLQAALLEGLTPAEYALRHDTPLHELELTVLELVQLGYLKDE